LPWNDAPAAVFSRDWKAPGDELLTYDDVNQREWLDLPYLIDAFPVASRDPERRYEAILPELLPGGSLEGFVVARRDDVTALALSAGIDVNVFSLAVNETAVHGLIDLLGATLSFPPRGERYSFGLLDEFANLASGPSRLTANVALVPPVGAAGLGFIPVAELNDDIPSRFTSVMLYRQIPEPATQTTLITMSLLLLLKRLRLSKNVVLAG
jgi:hypothetical protein